jgi:AcrR family transcriptional regulator
MGGSKAAVQRQRVQRQRIVEAALEVFAERGFRGTSIDAVAERAALTRQGVLHYFPSKNRLLMAILRSREDVVRRHLADLRPALDGGMPANLAQAVLFERGQPGFAQVANVLTAEAAAGREPARALMNERYAQLRVQLADHLAEQHGEQALPSGLDPRSAATAVVALMEGLERQWLVSGDPAGAGGADAEADAEPDYAAIVGKAVALLLGTSEQAA